jgi:hypothetical protein
MPDKPLGERLKHAWNAFRGRDDPDIRRNLGSSSYSKPDRVRVRGGNEQSIVVPILNRIAVDISSIRVRHVRTDENGSFEEMIKSGLNHCMTTEANLDQPSRAFMIDVAMSLFDEGCVAVVPVETSVDPSIAGGFDIHQLRTGRVLEWFPGHVRVSVYNERTGYRQELILSKKAVAIIENPLYAVMNERNSILQRLIQKLNILDAVDKQSGSGKLDLIIQLPYVIKTEARREQAEARRKDIESQLSGSQYGIAYTDGTERITQLNRPADNNLMTQIQYLTSMLFSQLGITEEVFMGTADEATMLNYMSRTVEPVLSAIVDEFKRKFLTKTARTQLQTIMYFKDIFRLVPANELANVADKYTRNEIMSSNEMRGILGLQPSKEARADELRNKNLNAPTEDNNKLKDALLEQEVEELRIANELALKGLKEGESQNGTKTEV